MEKFNVGDKFVNTINDLTATIIDIVSEGKWYRVEYEELDEVSFFRNVESKTILKEDLVLSSELEDALRQGFVKVTEFPIELNNFVEIIDAMDTSYIGKSNML